MGGLGGYSTATIAERLGGRYMDTPGKNGRSTQPIFTVPHGRISTHN
jgi:hypothetical protein